MIKIWVFTLVCMMILTGLSGPRDALLAPEEQLADPTLEARARALGQQVRCPVCESQSINDSTTPSAQTLRRVIQEQLNAGKEEAAILADLVDRYGSSILLSPPLTGSSFLLWLLPFLLFIGAIALWITRRLRFG